MTFGRRKRTGDEGGQATVEFALVLPLLLGVVTAIVQFGIVYDHQLQLTDAVRAGARAAAVGSALPDPAGAAVDAVVAAAPGLDAATLRAGTTVDSSWAAGGDVEVSATYPYSIRILGVDLYSGKLESSTTDRVE